MILQRWWWLLAQDLVQSQPDNIMTAVTGHWLPAYLIREFIHPPLHLDFLVPVDLMPTVVIRANTPAFPLAAPELPGSPPSMLTLGF